MRDLTDNPGRVQDISPGSSAATTPGTDPKTPHPVIPRSGTRERPKSERIVTSAGKSKYPPIYSSAFALPLSPPDGERAGGEGPIYVRTSLNSQLFPRNCRCPTNLSTESALSGARE